MAHRLQCLPYRRRTHSMMLRNPLCRVPKHVDYNKLVPLAYIPALSLRECCGWA